MQEHLNVVALVRDKKNDKFIFLWDNESTEKLYYHLEVLTADKELDFSLQNLIVVCKKIRELQAVNESGVLDFE